MRAWLTIGLFGLTLGVGSEASAHAFSMQECFEGGDFIAHAAQARDNGTNKQSFLDRLTADIRLIRVFPPELRWFVADAEDAEFLSTEASKVFDIPQLPEAHRAQFLSQCFVRMGPVV